MGEAGLLSIAFPAELCDGRATSLSTTTTRTTSRAPEAVDQGHNEGHDTVVARFRVTSNPDVADAGQRRADPGAQPAVCQPQRRLVAFGPDGNLYIGLGDGGDGGDPQNQAQNMGTLLGKILRVSVGATGTYTVPTDNPFGSTAGAKPEIWQYRAAQPVALEL